MNMSGGLLQKVASIPFILIFAIVILAPGAAAQYYVHLDFDWEGDDVSIQDHPKEEFESCPACHGEEHMGRPRICEDCHLANGQGPFLSGGDFDLRTDYEPPLVYEHYYRAEDVWVENKSFGDSLSTCFGIDPVIGGVCHGVSYVFRDGAGGYFAFNENWTEEARDRDPYEYTAPASSMPDTTDCLFCHNQVDRITMSAWGDAVQVDPAHSRLDIEECYRCHVEGGAAPASFHSRELLVSGGEQIKAGPHERRAFIGAIIALAGIVIYLLVSIRKGSEK
jgi:hypothetical protein